MSYIPKDARLIDQKTGEACSVFHVLGEDDAGFRILFVPRGCDFETSAEHWFDADGNVHVKAIQ